MPLPLDMAIRAASGQRLAKPVPQPATAPAAEPGAIARAGNAQIKQASAEECALCDHRDS
jgi:hypothetical protein